MVYGLKKKGRLFCAAVICSILTGCATREMTPQSVAIKNRFNKSVCVIPSCSEKPIPGFGFTARDRYFGPALENTIKAYGPFARLVPEKEADYRLEVCETHVTPPPAVFLDVTIENDMSWKLTPVHSDKPIWQDDIHGRYTAGMFDSVFSWIGLVRLRHANTGVVRENLKTGLEKISELPIQ